MTDSAIEPRAWSTRRQWVFISLIFAAQLWAVFHFRAGSSPATPPPDDAIRWRFFPGSLDSGELAMNLLGEDPTLLALPNRYGFSGPVWLAKPGMSDQPIGWSEPVHFLDLEISSLGSTLSSFLQKHDFPPFEAFSRDDPSSELPGFYLPSESPETNSILALGGELAGRGLEASPSLPAWPAAEVPASSIVRVSVNALGTVLSSALVGQSGLADADAAALRLTRELRFRPLSTDLPLLHNERGPLASGDVVFWWATLPSTNPAPPVSTLAP